MKIILVSMALTLSCGAAFGMSCAYSAKPRYTERVGAGGFGIEAPCAKGFPILVGGGYRIEPINRFGEEPKVDRIRMIHNHPNGNRDGWACHAVSSNPMDSAKLTCWAVCCRTDD